MLFLLSVLDKGCRDGGVVFDEPSIVSAFPQECPKGLQGVGDGPILDNGSVLQRNADSVSAGSRAPGI